LHLTMLNCYYLLMTIKKYISYIIIFIGVIGSSFYEIGNWYDLNVNNESYYFMYIFFGYLSLKYNLLRKISLLFFSLLSLVLLSGEIFGFINLNSFNFITNTVILTCGIVEVVNTNITRTSRPTRLLSRSLRFGCAGKDARQLRLTAQAVVILT
jgi:hypothetical protein